MFTHSGRRTKVNLLSATISVMSLFIMLAIPVQGKDSSRSKPRMNGWLALYDLVARRGNFVQRLDHGRGPMRYLDIPNGQIWVPVTGPTQPISGDTCEIRIGYVDQSISSYLPELKGHPEYETEKFTLDYDDKGCKGTFRNLRWNATRNTEERERYMRGFLTAPIFDYLGLVYLKGTRNYRQME